MNLLVAQQVALDDALVDPDNRVLIGKCNIRIEPTKIQKEATYQVVLDTLKLSPCYQAFLVTVDIPEIYMHQLPNQEFVEPPSHEEIVAFIKEIGYKGELESITKLYIDHMSQPWRTFASIISKCLSGKTTDFMYQIDNKQTTTARRSNMPYPMFTKAIIQYFISKDKTISMRNNLFMHSIKNDSVLGVLKFISKYEENQVYCKPIPDVMMSKEIMETTTYKTYLAFATGKSIPKKARKRMKAHITPMKESSFIADGNIIFEDPDAALELAKSISRTEAQEKKAARLTTGLSEGAGLIPEVPDKPKVNFAATNVLEESWGDDSDTEKSDEEEVPWIFSDDEEDDNDDDQSIDIEEMDDDERTESDNDDQAMDDAEKNDKDKEEEEKIPIKNLFKMNKLKMSQSVSSNYGNQFLISSPECSLLGTVKESTDAEITSMVDVQIQQEILYVLSAPLFDVLAYVVPATLTNPTPPPIPTSTTTTTTKSPSSSTAIPDSETLSGL
ncbi:hypothetical protein Tco_0904346 [Tanacetum coccineum]